MVPEGVDVVSAFHTVSAALLTDLDHELDEDVLICGDRREDKAKVAELVNQIDGLRPVDCGPLEMARIVEQLTPLLISINVRNKVRAGIKITGLTRIERAGRRARRRHRRRQARPRHARRGRRRRARRDREHRRRHRDLRRVRVARPGPRHVLARGPDRRAWLGPGAATRSPSWTA